VYAKNSYSECVYCGETADTREHVPSRVFLEKPFPENLPIVPACYTCNNSFSGDELFLSILLERIKLKYIKDNYSCSDRVRKRIEENKIIVDNIDTVLNDNKLEQLNERICNVLTKLAIGHAVYELSVGYPKDDDLIVKYDVFYSFSYLMSSKEIEDFTTPYILNEALLPEVGSRGYEKILVLDLKYGGVEDTEKWFKSSLILLDWVNVQQDKYEYTCLLSENEVNVKIVIDNIMFAQVTFKY
jgi:hypothetical protein